LVWPFNKALTFGMDVVIFNLCGIFLLFSYLISKSTFEKAYSTVQFPIHKTQNLFRAQALSHLFAVLASWFVRSWSNAFHCFHTTPYVSYSVVHVADVRGEISSAIVGNSPLPSHSREIIFSWRREAVEGGRRGFEAAYASAAMSDILRQLLPCPIWMLLEHDCAGCLRKSRG
jgi:hypothetical protein